MLTCLPAFPDNMIIILTLHSGRGRVRAAGLVDYRDLSHLEGKKDTQFD